MSANDQSISLDHLSQGYAETVEPYRPSNTGFDEPTHERVSGGQLKEKRKAETQSLVSAGLLPDVPTVENGSGWKEVAKDLTKGAIREIKEHPIRVLGSAAIGVGTAVLSPFVAPGVAVAAGVAAAAYGGYELYQNGGSWIRDARVVALGQADTPEDLARAHRHLEELGAGAADVAAGAAGGLAAGAIRSVFVKSSLANATKSGALRTHATGEAVEKTTTQTTGALRRNLDDDFWSKFDVKTMADYDAEFRPEFAPVPMFYNIWNVTPGKGYGYTVFHHFLQTVGKGNKFVSTDFTAAGKALFDKAAAKGLIQQVPGPLNGGVKSHWRVTGDPFYLHS